MRLHLYSLLLVASHLFGTLSAAPISGINERSLLPRSPAPIPSAQSDIGTACKIAAQKIKKGCKDIGKKVTKKVLKAGSTVKKAVKGGD
jgi:hypothetical protein